MPSLLPENTLVNLLPSLDIAITNVLIRSFPLCQLIPTLQITFSLPKSSWIHDPRPRLDQRVLKFWSIACDGGFNASAPLAVIPVIESFEHELAALNGSDWPKILYDWTSVLIKIRTKNVTTDTRIANWLPLHAIHEDNLSKLITIIWLKLDIISCYLIFVDWVLQSYNVAVGGLW